MEILLASDFHLELFKRKERIKLLNRWLLFLKKKEFNILIINGDFWAGGKKNSKKVKNLLWKIEKKIGRKIIHFPGSHEDFSHAYKHTFYLPEVLLIPGSQTYASHGQKPVRLNIREYKDFLEFKPKLVVTHDPFPETVDKTVYGVSISCGGMGIFPFFPLLREIMEMQEKKIKEVCAPGKKVKLNEKVKELTLIGLEYLKKEAEYIGRMVGKKWKLNLKIEKVLKLLPSILGSLGWVEIMYGSCLSSPEMYKFRDELIKKKVKFVISGHIHENFFLGEQIVKKRDTVFVNPGPAYLGFYSLIDLDNNRIEVGNITEDESS